MKYPPFCDILIIGFNSLDENEIKKVSNKSYEYLIKKLNNEKFKIFKPMPSPIDKIQNRFRWRIIIKGNMNEQANEILNDLLKEIENPYIFLKYINKELQNENSSIDKKLIIKSQREVNSLLTKMENENGKIYKVINWFLKESNEENPITHLSLQKSLYFVQS